MANGQRAAVLTGMVAGVRYEAPGKTTAMIAEIELENADGAASQLNAQAFTLVSEIDLRGAEYNWLGKRVRVSVIVEVIP